MTKHVINVERATGTEEGFLSSQDVGTDALNAIRSIPGVENPEIVSESDRQATLEYNWAGGATYWETNERLGEFGLRRVE